MADDLEDDQWLYGDSSEDKNKNDSETKTPQVEPEAPETEETSDASQVQPTVIFHKIYNITLKYPNCR